LISDWLLLGSDLPARRALTKLVTTLDSGYVEYIITEKIGGCFSRQ